MIVGVLIRGVDIHLQDSGYGSPAFLWAHGFGSCIAHEDSAHLMDFTLIAESSRLIRWDARGHGESSAPFMEADAYSWTELALDTVAIADYCRLESVVLGGLSMGVATALHAAAIDPSRTKGLILVLPPAAYEYRGEERARYFELARIVEAEGIAQYMNAKRGDPRPSFLRDMPLEERLPEQTPTVLANLLRGAAASDLPTMQELERITSPTLILTWADDTGHPVAVADKIAASLKDVDFHLASDLREVADWTPRINHFLVNCC